MPSTLPETEVLVLLSDHRRRILLRVLRESTAPLTLDGLAARIEEREATGPAQNGQWDVRSSLYHNHLPRLDEADVLEYDESDGTVAPGDNFDGLLDVLESTTPNELPWSDA